MSSGSERGNTTGMLDYRGRRATGWRRTAPLTRIGRDYNDKIVLRTRRRRMRFLTRLLCLAAAMLGCSAGPALAAYPDRPITLIVPWGAGGGTDAVARILASLMEKDLGEPVNVVNRT